MIDYIRENLSYYPMYYRMFKVKKEFTPERVDFGSDKDQYLLYYEPAKAISDKVIIWIHGGGWKKLKDEAVDNDTFKARVRETCGVETVLKEGDASYAHSGVSHAIENRSDKPAKMLAVILKV